MKYTFVLGNMRSGTSWVSRVMAKSPTPLRYFEEPFAKLKKEYCRRSGLREPWSVHIDDPNLIYYKRLLERFDDNFVDVFKKGVVGVSVVENSNDPQFILVKEVHNIPSFHKIIKGLDYKIVFVNRSPFRILDSNFYNFKNLSIYKDEYVWLREAVTGGITIKNDYYLKAMNALNNTVIDYIKEPMFDKDWYIQFFIAVLFNQFIMHYWNNTDENTYMVQYEELCFNKIAEFKKIFDFVGFVYNNSVTEFVESCSKRDGRTDPYSIYRKNYLIADAEYKFLTNEQLEILNCIYNGE